MEGEQLPKGWEEKPPDSCEIPKGVYVIQCDAGYKDGITGISTLIKTHEKEYQPREYSARNKGPVHAELTAVCKALERVKTIRKTIEVCIVYTDCLYAYYFLRELQIAKCYYIKEIIDGIRSEICEFENREIEVIICHTKSRNNKRIDRRAGKKRQEEENRKREQIDKRIETVERAITRGREIRIYESNGEYFAMPRNHGFPPGYKVSLTPLLCECPWWKHNWGNKGQHIVNARALPCKHICALLEYLEKDVYQFFSLQIGRVD